MPPPPVVTRKFLLQCAGGLGLTAAMYLMGLMGLAMEARTRIGVVPLWLPSGIALGGFFLLGRLAIPFLWLGSLFISSTVHQGPLAAVFAAGDVVSAWVGWWLLTRMPEFDKEFRTDVVAGRRQRSSCLRPAAAALEYGVGESTAERRTRSGSHRGVQHHRPASAFSDRRPRLRSAIRGFHDWKPDGPSAVPCSALPPNTAGEFKQLPCLTSDGRGSRHDLNRQTYDSAYDPGHPHEG
jgi:hypothetical protein